MSDKKKCNGTVEIFSRIVGYFSPVKRWNEGRKEEWSERKKFDRDANLKDNSEYSDAVLPEKYE